MFYPSKKILKLIFLGKGFTFIELLVVISIMAILFGFGYARFRDFQKRQYLDSAARMLISDLKMAQESALAGRKLDILPPPNTKCIDLIAYFFYRLSNQRYEIRILCNGNDYSNNAGLVVTRNFPQGISFSYSYNPSMCVNGAAGGAICFYPSGRGTNLTYDLTITLNFQGVGQKTITITPGGTIY